MMETNNRLIRKPSSSRDDEISTENLSRPNLGIPEEATDFVICLAKSNPCIYDRKIGANKNRMALIDSAWNSISVQVKKAFPEIECDAALLRRYWETLRSRYNRLRKDGPLVHQKDMPFLESMSFLDRHIYPRRPNKVKNEVSPLPSRTREVGADRAKIQPTKPVLLPAPPASTIQYFALVNNPTQQINIKAAPTTVRAVSAVNTSVADSSVERPISRPSPEPQGKFAPDMASSLKSNFNATFTFNGNPFVELRGNFMENTKHLRGLMHNMFKYLKKLDNNASVAFTISEPKMAKKFGLLCLSPTLKAYFDGFAQPFVQDVDVEPRSLKAEHGCDSVAAKNLKEPASEEAEEDLPSSIYEPSVIVDEEVLNSPAPFTPVACDEPVAKKCRRELQNSKPIRNSDQVSQTSSVVEAEENRISGIFSRETFEEEDSYSSGSDRSSDEAALDADEDIDHYFKSLNNERRSKEELRRAQKRENDRLRKRKDKIKVPNTELTAKRVDLLQTLLPQFVYSESEKEKFTAIFDRNKLTEMSEYVGVLVENPNFIFKCRCDGMFPGKEVYKEHYCQCVGDGPVMFYCMLCEQIRNEEEMPGHVRAHFYDEGCLVCDFTTIKSFMQHRVTHILSEKFPTGFEEHEVARWTCRVCEPVHKIFKKDKFHFRRHLIWSHANPGQCELCGFQFDSHSKLRNHKKSAHYTAKSCKNCGEFLETYALFRRHSCDDGRRVCVVCGKEVNRLQVNRHMKEVHGDREKRTYKCAFCEATFVRHTQMKQHENMHRGEKPYVCLICNKSHTSLAALGGHTRSRHNMTTVEMREYARNQLGAPDYDDNMTAVEF